MLVCIKAHFVTTTDMDRVHGVVHQGFNASHTRVLAETNWELDTPNGWRHVRNCTLFYPTATCMYKQCDFVFL